MFDHVDCGEWVAWLVCSFFFYYCIVSLPFILQTRNADYADIKAFPMNALWLLGKKKQQYIHEIFNQTSELIWTMPPDFRKWNHSTAQRTLTQCIIHTEEFIYFIFFGNEKLPAQIIIAVAFRKIRMKSQPKFAGQFSRKRTQLNRFNWGWTQHWLQHCLFNRILWQTTRKHCSID